MKKRSLALVALALFCSGLVLADGAPDTKEKTGYALLDMYIRSFQEMATRGTGGEVVREYLVKMAREFKRASEANEIDLVFQARFGRVLAMTSLFASPDPDNILKPVIERELADFLKDVTGEEVLKIQGHTAIGQVANALAEEIINLNIYLDTKGAREALRKKLEARISGAEKQDL
jgi:hypothetical protein